MKKSIIITLFLLCLLTIGAVNASDNLTDDTISLEQDNNVADASDSITEPKQEVNDITVDKTNDAINKETNAKTEDKNTKLENVRDEDVLSDDDSFEVTFSESSCYSGDDTLITVVSHTDEGGTLKVYVDSEKNPRKTYTIKEGKFEDNNNYNPNSLYVKIKDLGLTDGTYNIQLKFNENLFAKKEITYKYDPFNINTWTTIYYSYITYDSYGYPNSKLGPDISFKGSFNENGTLNVYVNDEKTPRKIYTIQNGRFITEDTNYQSYPYYYGSSSLIIPLKDLKIVSGTYNLTLKYKQKGSNDDFLIKKGLVTYKYDPFSIGNGYMDNPIHLYSRTDENGTLNLYFNNEKIPKTYKISRGKFIIDGVSESSLTLTMEELGLNSYNNKLTVTFKAENNEELFNETYNNIFYFHVAYVYKNIYSGEDYAIDFYSFGIGNNGTFKVYVNGEEKKKFVIKENRFENISHSYYGDYYGVVYVNELGITKNGIYNIKVTFQEPNKNEMIVTEEAINYFYMDLDYSSIVNINKTVTINAKMTNDINGNLNAYTANSIWIGGESYVYEKNKQIGTSKITNGIATLTLLASKINESCYGYESSDNIIILEITTNKETINRNIGIYVDTYYEETEHEGNNGNNNPNSGTNTENNNQNSGTDTGNGNNNQNSGTNTGNNGNNNNQNPSTTTPTTGSSNTISNTQTNKQTIKITAPTKTTFKAKAKTKKYSATIKNKKGKAIKKATIKLTIEGKKYTVRTNNKGKATFKIKNLKKKGKYTAVIIYKRIKRTVKIIVK